eukprot:3819333-Heterocapsa_arctica.AAC.1
MDTPLLRSSIKLKRHDIDFDEKRDSKKDPTNLAKDKKQKEGDTYSCEQEKKAVEEERAATYKRQKGAKRC